MIAVRFSCPGLLLLSQKPGTRYKTSGIAIFQNQILIVSLTANAFSQGGDFGSLIVSDRGNSPVGLLFAGSASHTIANQIPDVLSALNVTIFAYAKISGGVAKSLSAFASRR